MLVGVSRFVVAAVIFCMLLSRRGKATSLLRGSAGIVADDQLERGDSQYFCVGIERLLWIRADRKGVVVGLRGFSRRPGISGVGGGVDSFDAILYADGWNTFRFNELISSTKVEGRGASLLNG